MHVRSILCFVFLFVVWVQVDNSLFWGLLGYLLYEPWAFLVLADKSTFRRLQYVFLLLRRVSKFLCRIIILRKQFLYMRRLNSLLSSWEKIIDFILMNTVLAVSIRHLTSRECSYVSLMLQTRYAELLTLSIGSLHEVCLVGLLSY